MTAEKYSRDVELPVLKGGNTHPEKNMNSKQSISLSSLASTGAVQGGEDA